MYCFNCGKEVDEKEEKCPNCQAELKTTKNEKQKICLCPVTFVGLLFSSIAFLFGFILTTCALAKGWGMESVQVISLVPAMIGLGIGVYKLLSSPEKTTKILSIISVALSGFSILYAFVGFMVMIV